MADMVLSTVEYGTRIGSPLVALHGAWSAKEIWEDFSAERGVCGRRWVCLDHRGHGDSPKRLPYTVLQMSRDVVTTLDALGIARFDLIGHSLGGHVASSVAKEVPSRVRSVVLLDPPAMTNEEMQKFRRRIRRPLAKLAEHKFETVDELVETLWGALSRPARAHVDRDVRALLEQTDDGCFRIRADPRLFDAAYSRGGYGDVPPTFGSFDGRVLLLAGGKFDAVTENGLSIMRSELGALLTALRIEAAHWLFWDSRQQVAELVGSFLDDVERSDSSATVQESESSMNRPPIV